MHQATGSRGADVETPKTVQRKRDRMPHTQNSPMVNWGLVLSLALNLIGGAFSVGVLYTRVLNLESTMIEVKTHAQSRDDKLGEVLQKLSAIDERLKAMAERRGRADK